jgi:hypothetical protein
MKRLVILGAMIVTLGASSASAEKLSPSAKRGVNAANDIVVLAELLTMRARPSEIQETFGPCEEHFPMLDCGRMYFVYGEDGLTQIAMGVAEGQDVANLKDWVAAAAFRLSAKLKEKFTKEGVKLFWRIPGLEFFVSYDKDDGDIAVIAVRFPKEAK